MNIPKILIIGSGHLAKRIERAYDDVQCSLVRTSFQELLAGSHGSIVDVLDRLVTTVNPTAIFVVDDDDQCNLHSIIALFSLAPTAQVFASVFNERLVPHFRLKRSNFHIFHPPEVAAPEFVEALEVEKREIQEVPPQPCIEKRSSRRGSSVLTYCVLAYSIVLFGAVSYFHLKEGFSWIDAVYFVVVTMSTVGYGDINLLNAPSHSKLFGIALILTSMVFVWLIFSLTFDSLLRRRAERNMGHRQYRNRDHVIVCGLGRLGLCIVELLLKKGEEIIVIESDPHNSRIEECRRRGVAVYIGDARSDRVLSDVVVDKAKALYSVINDDAINLEIGLTARTIQPRLRVILRIFDEKIAEMVRETLDIYLTRSTSKIVADNLKRKHLGL